MVWRERKVVWGGRALSGSTPTPRCMCSQPQLVRRELRVVKGCSACLSQDAEVTHRNAGV